MHRTLLNNTDRRQARLSRPNGRQRSIRLHVEHLEARFLMTGNQALAQFELTNQFEGWLIEKASLNWGYYFGRSFQMPAELPLNSDNVDPKPVFPETDGWDLIADSADFSNQTNVQVAGVDEADLIETDGEYLYMLSDDYLTIVQAGFGDELEVMSRLPVKGDTAGMYLSDDRLTIVTTSPHPIWAYYGYTHHHFDWTTTVTVLDVENRAAPQVVQKTEMDGRLVSSRAVDGSVRLVLDNDILLPRPIARAVGKAPPSDHPWDSREHTMYVYETAEEYAARLQYEVLKDVLPRARSIGADGNLTAVVPLFTATDVYRPQSLMEDFMTTVATFDMMSNESGPVSTATVMTGGGGQIYATADSIYLMAEEPHWSVNFGDYVVRLRNTDVWKFSMDAQANDVELVATGEIEATILNQFAVDERDGYLRIVTKPLTWTADGHGMRVLQHVGDELKLVGMLEGIAPRENLHSVRFVDDRAFFVTFRFTDPLFVVDLSAPTAPTLIGELHIPGFSEYLQPIDDEHLLGIGRGADERTGQFQELQLSVFDVTDAAHPLLEYRYSFPQEMYHATTPVTGSLGIRGDGDHHALSYFPSEQILAIPVHNVNYAANVGTGDPTTEIGARDGLAVFEIDPMQGFVLLAFIEHDEPIERSLKIGDRLFAISRDTITVHELMNPDVQLVEVHFSGGDEIQVPPWGEWQVGTWSPQTFQLKWYETALPSTFGGASANSRQLLRQLANWALPTTAPRLGHLARSAAFAQSLDATRIDESMLLLLAADAENRGTWQAPDASLVEDGSASKSDRDRPSKSLDAMQDWFAWDLPA